MVQNVYFISQKLNKKEEFMHIKKYFLVIFTVIGLVLLLLIFLNEKNSHCNILEIFIPTVYNNPSEKCKLRLINTLNKSEIPIMQVIID